MRDTPAREGKSAIAPLSDEAALGVVGAILELVGMWIEAGRTAELQKLAAPLSAFVAHNVIPRK